MSDSKPSTKERILAAAEIEFLSGGYDRARMQAIADRAQINKAMLHYHFRSKDELFTEIFQSKVRLLFPKMEGLLAEQPDFIQFTCGFIEAYFALLIENPYLPFFLLRVAENHVELLENAPIAFPKLYVQAFELAAQRGEVRPHSGKQFLVALLGMCVMPFVGKNLIKTLLNLEEPQYQELLQTRAEEIKRYVVLLLTPPSASNKEKENRA